MDLYKYRGVTKYIVDGDTLDVLVDLGFCIYKKQRIRLYGIDCPEVLTRNEKEKQAGLIVKSFMYQFLNKEVDIKSYSVNDKYGRYVAELFYQDISINNILLKIKYAKKYYGGTKPGWTNDELNNIIYSKYFNVDFCKLTNKK